MIGLGIAFIVVGLIFLFTLFWVGVPVALIGIVLVILYVVGFGRRTVHGDQPQQPR